MKELISALIKVQQEISSVSKDSSAKVTGVSKGTGKSFEYSYRYTTLAHVIDALYPVLAKNGFAISQMINGDYLETKLMHTSGQILESKAPLIYKQDDLQRLGAAISYVRRYSLMTIVGIASDDDDDAQSLAKPPIKPSGYSNQPTQSTVKVPLPNKAPQTKAQAEDWTKQYEKNSPIK